MSNVIDFLERIGSDARLRDGARLDIERALADAGVDSTLRDPLAKGDLAALEKLLGAKTDMCCLIHAPDDKDEGGGDEQEDGDKQSSSAAMERLHC